MKFLYSILIILLFLASCSDEEAPKDIETNRYYADYIEIYNAYDSLGGEKTLALLETYMEEYPERKEAYIFKGYILGTLGKYTEADLLFEEAKKRDSANVNIYEYQSAFLLYDSTQMEKTQAVIKEGLAISDSSSSLYRSLAWHHLFNNEYDEVIESVLKGGNINPQNLNIYRPGLIAADYLVDEKNYTYFANILEANNIDTKEILEIQYMKGSYAVYKSIPYEY